MITKSIFFALIDLIGANDESVIGNYEYKNYHILIRKNRPLTNAEKYKRFYLSRREKGQCVQCGEMTGTNKKTGKPYRYCLFHRKQEGISKKIKRQEKKIEKK